MFRESIKMSWNNIRSNKMRSFLTMLGIIIGVSSIIALITIVQGSTNTITNEIEILGADKINISVRGTPLRSGLLDQDLRRLLSLDNLDGISPALNGNTSIVYKGEVRTNITVSGRNEIYFSKNDGAVVYGRPINILDLDGRNKVCLIGHDIARDLFFGIDPLGEELKIEGISYIVTGILKETTGFSASNTNNMVIIPYTTAMSFLGTRYIRNVDVYIDDMDIIDDTIREIEALLDQIFNNAQRAYSITKYQDILDIIKTITGTLSLMLGGIASISLIVGGIGIMNMMLVSVTERTAEIGLRKALGAHPGRIRQQFLIESVFLSFIGGILGLLLGLVLAYMACAAIGIVFSVSAGSIILALGFSSFIGVIFGYAPARKASNLNPIDALRSI